MVVNSKHFLQKQKIEYSLPEQKGFRPIRWKGTVFFVDNEDTLLLGTYQCLDQLKITLDGKHRKLKVDKS
jgi:hypothetical protein